MSTNATISIEELSTQSLPIFGHSARAFRKLSSEENAAFEGYGDILFKDPGLALHTLNQLQANATKPLSVEISSMSQAAMLLGMEQVQKLPIGQPQIERSLRGFAKKGFIKTACRSFHAAFQAWDWAHIKKDHAPDQIFLAALLHDVAEMALWVSAPDKMHQFRKLMLKDGISTDEAQYIVFGESLEHFSRQLARQWHLPPLVQEALRPENVRESRVQGVMLAVQLARAAERNWYWEKTERLMPQIADYLGKPLDMTISHVHMNAVRAAREAPFYDARHAAALLPMLPGGDEIIIEDEFPEAEAEIEAAVQIPGEPQASGASANARAEEISPPPAQTVKPVAREQTNIAQVCLTPQPEVFAQSFSDLKKGIGNLKLNDLMRTAIHGMHDGIGLNRVVFTMLTPDRSTLISRFLIGADNDPIFSRFVIKLDKPHLFTRLMEKQVSLWVNDDNRAKYWPLVPGQVKTLIKTNSFFVMSIHLRGKPIGLFYADRRSVECKLDAHAYTQFRQLCQLVTKGLASLSNSESS